MGKSTISMAIFNSYVSLPEGTCCYCHLHLTLHRFAEALGTRAEKAFRRSSEVIWAMMALFATSPQSGAVKTWELFYDVSCV